MKKYVPSVKNNNALKEEFLAEMNAVIYRLEKGKTDPALEADAVAAVAKDLRESSASLEAAIGTGEEDVALIAEDAAAQLKELKKQTNQALTNRLEAAAEDLEYTVILWKDVLNGNTAVGTPEELEERKISFTRKRLNARLAELGEIKAEFVAAGKRLEADITAEERDLAELEDKMLKEDNERKINDLFRQIKAIKSKIDMLTVRNNHYSACFNLLEMIYANAREILEASGFARSELAKAKVLLNLDKLRKVVTDPDKAVAILRRMEADIQEISAQTATMDKKVFGLENGAATVSDDAMKYKEELMRKKREKEALHGAIPSAPQTIAYEKETEEKENGIL